MSWRLSTSRAPWARIFCLLVSLTGPSVDFAALSSASSRRHREHGRRDRTCSRDARETGLALQTPGASSRTCEACRRGRRSSRCQAHRPAYTFSTFRGPRAAEALPPNPSEWTERVERAIERGREALLPRLAPLVDDPRSDYPVGRMAFVLCALLEAGLPTREPIVARALERLARLEPAKTYGVACYLLLLGALLDRLEEEGGGATAGARRREEGIRDGEREDEAREPPPLGAAALRAKVEDLAAWLVDARTKSRGTWTYEVAGRGRKHDFSNTQFAVLGLHVAMKHGVAIPSEVFDEIIRIFSGSIQLENDPVTLTYRPAASFEAVLGLEAPPRERRTRVRPGGWAYRASGSRAKQPAYPAMTAAGASSVIVAVKALRQLRGGRHRRAVLEGEKALHRAYAWIETRFDDFVADGRNLYYTLYSLEKVGDLGEIAAFGGRDWYLEGAQRLLEKQRKSGSWGGYVETSFALLFLTRATRSVGAAAAPTLLTRGGKGGDGETAGTDLVHVDRAGGFLSARALLRYMAKTRDPRLVEIGREVVRNYDPAHREDLVPHLLTLWTEPGRLRTFARRALKDITGETFRKSGDAARWYEAFLEIESLEESAAARASDVAERLRGSESPALKARLVRLARRRDLRSLARDLTREMARAARLRTPAAATLRRALHGVLDLWTGAGIRMPADGDGKGWESAAREWEEWLRRNDVPAGREP